MTFFFEMMPKNGRPLTIDDDALKLMKPLEKLESSNNTLQRNSYKHTLINRQGLSGVSVVIKNEKNIFDTRNFLLSVYCWRRCIGLGIQNSLFFNQ